MKWWMLALSVLTIAIGVWFMATSNFCPTCCTLPSIAEHGRSTIGVLIMLAGLFAGLYALTEVEKRGN